MERFITVTRSKSVRNANDIQNETNESEKDRDLSISNAEDNSDGGASEELAVIVRQPDRTDEILIKTENIHFIRPKIPMQFMISFI